MPQDLIPADSAQWLVRLMKGRGIPLENLLAETGLPSAWPEMENARIAPAQYLRLVGNALDAGEDPALGLAVGRSQNLSEFGFWGYAIISSPTLGEAMDMAVRFWELNGSLVRLTYTAGGETDIVGVAPAFPMPDRRLWVFAVEELLSTLHSGACFIANREVPLAEIRLSYPDPGYGGRYRELFGCPVFFNEEKTEFSIPAFFRDVPTATGHPQVAELCRRQCREMMAGYTDTDDLVRDIRQIITNTPGRLLRLEEAARDLAMSPRTLRRRLRGRRTSFQNILDEVRTELSKQYLRTTDLSVEQISDRIGFSEVSTFYQAFKKWTGMSVKEYRRM